MATALKNLSDYDINSVPQVKDMRVAIVVAEWNYEITGALLKGALETLTKHGVSEEDIIIKHVPGTFELTFAASALVNSYMYDAVIVLGCVIQGETRHFDFICQGVSTGITDLNNEAIVPVIFGVLTTNNLQQAIDRAGGKHGNKGNEAAITAIKMIALNSEIIEESELDEDWELEEWNTGK